MAPAVSHGDCKLLLVVAYMQSRAVQERRARSASCARQGACGCDPMQALHDCYGPRVRAARTSGNSTSPEPSASTSASISVTCGQAGAPVTKLAAQVCSAAGVPSALQAAKRLLGAFEPHGLSAQLHIQAGLLSFRDWLAVAQALGSKSQARVKRYVGCTLTTGFQVRTNTRCLSLDRTARRLQLPAQLADLRLGHAQVEQPEGLPQLGHIYCAAAVCVNQREAVLREHILLCLYLDGMHAAASADAALWQAHTGGHNSAKTTKN